MVKEIRRKGVIVLRVHVSGDFASAEYAQKWLDIFKQCPKVRFYGYTRSYRIPAIVSVLEQMAALKNVHLWYSLDSETGTPEHVPSGVRLAYLQISEEDQPEQADLLFRAVVCGGRFPSR
jgi:Gene product 88